MLDANYQQRQSGLLAPTFEANTTLRAPSMSSFSSSFGTYIGSCKSARKVAILVHFSTHPENKPKSCSWMLKRKIWGWISSRWQNASSWEKVTANCLFGWQPGFVWLAVMLCWAAMIYKDHSSVGVCLVPVRSGLCQKRGSVLSWWRAPLLEPQFSQRDQK